MVLATATATDLAQIGFATFEAGRQSRAEHKYCLAIQLKYKPETSSMCVRVCAIKLKVFATKNRNS